jgi:hypothetical protein
MEKIAEGSLPKAPTRIGTKLVTMIASICLRALCTVPLSLIDVDLQFNVE